MDPGVILFFIPIAGIALGGFVVWLKHKEKMALAAIGKRDSSRLAQQDNSELFDDVVLELDRLKEENSGMKRRLQTLEAIVTDEAFDEIVGKKASQPSTIDAQLEEMPDESESPRIGRRTRS